MRPRLVGRELVAKTERCLASARSSALRVEFGGKIDIACLARATRRGAEQGQPANARLPQFAFVRSKSRDNVVSRSDFHNPIIEEAAAASARRQRPAQLRLMALLLGPVAADLHLAPTPALVLGRVEKKPAAMIALALLDAGKVGLG